ncbi:putative Glycosyl transferase group 1 [Candidatus Zixiibacteriota bacterium]|nr:putative Glycosyl transferase group 1 [candidate division Zixibacteria bacterium]
MRIGVDCHVLSGKNQGSRTYLTELYREIVQIPSDNEYVFLGYWDKIRPFGNDFQHISFPSKSRAKRLLFSAAELTRKIEIELFHSTYIVPFNLKAKSLLTIHDILFETMPKYFSRSFVMRSKILVRRAALSAEIIQTISKYSRTALMERYNLPEDRVRIVPCGVDLDLFSPVGKKESQTRIASRHGGLRDYIFTVGRLEPRKNHIGLINSYALLKKKIKFLPKLVIAGHPDFGYDEIYRHIAEKNLKEDILILGDVTPSELPDLYRAAHVFVYPSFAEGFGLPPLEAMACGIPVISSDRSAIPEVVGDGGILINPDNIEELAYSIERILDDSELAVSLGRRGRQNAEKWSWKNAAIEYLESLSLMREKKSHTNFKEAIF